MPLNICDFNLVHSVLCFVQIILKLCNYTRLLIVIYSAGICVIVVVQAACERPSEASAHFPRLERTGLLLHLHTASWTRGNPPSMIILRCCIFCSASWEVVNGDISSKLFYRVSWASPCLLLWWVADLFDCMSYYYGNENRNPSDASLGEFPPML
jgi:hypothetical protein